MAILVRRDDAFRPVFLDGPLPLACRRPAPGDEMHHVLAVTRDHLDILDAAGSSDRTPGDDIDLGLPPEQQFEQPAAVEIDENAPIRFALHRHAGDRRVQDFRIASGEIDRDV